DMDGMTSFSILYNYIKEVYPKSNLTYKQHVGKQHGISDIVVDEEVSLVIIPDAGTNDFEDHKKLKDKGIDILVIDHHKGDKFSENAIVINNQLSSNVSNKNLSGAGVCYKFITALDDYLGECYASNFIDLACVGNIADVMDLHEKETRYYVYQGIKKTNNLFLQALKEIKSYDLDGKYNIEKVGWTIAPIVNGTIRSGTIAEKSNMVKAFISDDYDFCLKVANDCKNVKARQDRAVKTGLEKIINEIDMKENDRVLFINSGKLSGTHRGLIAGKLADRFGVPIFIYSDSTKDSLGGSFRGADNISENLYKDIKESNIGGILGGHEQAGGWTCKKDNIEEFKKYLNNLYKDKEIKLGKEYEVDFILEKEELEQWFVDEIASYEDEWGNKINKPLVVIQNVDLMITDDNIKATNIIFEVNGIKFIKKYATKILKDSLRDKAVNCDVIGSCTVNSYNGIGQIEIEDIV
ncbi:MAG: DHH family phosphoesterase, partial [Clostridium sp.]